MAIAVPLARLAAVVSFLCRSLRDHGKATRDARVKFETENPREGRTIEPSARRTGWTMSEIRLPLEPSGRTLEELLLENFSEEFATAGTAEALVELSVAAFPKMVHVQKGDRLLTDGTIVPSFRVALGPKRETPAS